MDNEYIKLIPLAEMSGRLKELVVKEEVIEKDNFHEAYSSENEFTDYNYNQ